MRHISLMRFLGDIVRTYIRHVSDICPVIYIMSYIYRSLVFSSDLALYLSLPARYSRIRATPIITLIPMMSGTGFKKTETIFVACKYWKFMEMQTLCFFQFSMTGKIFSKNYNLFCSKIRTNTALSWKPRKDRKRIGNG